MPLDASTSSAGPAAPSDEHRPTDPHGAGTDLARADSTAATEERDGHDRADGRAGGGGGRDGDGHGAGEPAGRGARLGRMAVIVVVTALVAMWGYVVYLAFGPGRQPPVDRLDDPAFARAAEDRCATAVADVDDLPLAQDSPTPGARAEVLEQANGIFGSMLEDLGDMTRLAPAGEQRERAQRWLADWEIYMGDRERYADALRSDPEARFLISEKDDTGRHITGWIDEFAKANRMPSCATPTDV